MFLGKAAISIATTVGCYLWITRVEYYKTRITSPATFGIIFAILSYSIACLFMNVWNMAGRTILHCYFIDIEVNEGFPKMCPE